MSDAADLTEFVLARKTDETEQEIIGRASEYAMAMGLTPVEMEGWFAAFDRTLYAHAARFTRATRNLGWALLAVLAPPIVKREAARWSWHPDWREEWRV